MTRFRISLASTLLLALVAGPASADEVKGKVKSVDAEKRSITVTADSTDKVYPLTADAKVVGLMGKKIKKATLGDLAGGLGGVKEGADVVLTTQTKDGSPEVTQVKVEGLQAPKKKKNKVK